MNSVIHQLDLFNNTSLNTTYEIKRQIRLALADCGLSRDEVADRMTEIAVKEGMRPGKKNGITRATLDNWCKDSEPERVPSIVWLTIFCHVAGTVKPIEALLRPVGCGVLRPEDMRLLAWARAEMDRKRAAKRARLAMELID